jgi:dTDP-L-rhamnose 4-epimerase
VPAAADLEAGAFDPRCPACGAQLSWMPVREDAALDPRNAYATKTVASFVTSCTSVTWQRATCWP